MTLAVDIRQIQKAYGVDDARQQVLNGVSLKIQTGEFIALTGPSGCGKSTLLSILGLLEHADSGSYLLHGEPMDALGFDARSRTRNQHIGFIFQSFNLINDLSVLGNVLLPTRYAQRADPKRQTYALELLELVGLAHKSAAYPWQLSGGQQQRVAIARALIMQPNLLLADEPTGNLDAENGEKIIETLLALCSTGKTIILVTHDLQLAARATRSISMRDGRLLVQGD